MRDAITKNTQTTTHLKPPSTKVFPSRTRARNTRARYARARPTSLADTPARLRSQALPATSAVNQQPTANRQAAPCLLRRSTSRGQPSRALADQRTACLTPAGSTPPPAFRSNRLQPS